MVYAILMRKILAFSYLLLVAGFACIAHAQLSQTGAGPKAGGGGGGGFTPCAGTPGYHSANPNDLTTATGGWASSNTNVTFGSPDPVGGSTASDLVSTTGGGSGNVHVDSSIGTRFTLNLGTTYSFGAYYKSIAVPVWLIFGVSDGIANAFQSWFNIATSVVGNPSVAGAGNNLTCARAGAAGNGYTQLSVAGNLSANNTGMFVSMGLVDGNGTNLSTVNQEFLAWQVTP